MKKIMILAAISAAINLNAATYEWNCSSDWVAENDLAEDTPFIGNKVYFFDASVLSAYDFIKALGTDGAAAFDKAFASTGSIDGTEDYYGSFNFSGSGINDDGGESTKYINGYAVILDAASLDNAKYAYVAEFDPIKVTDGVEKSGANFYQEAIYTGSVGGAGWYEVSSVPEPTSGLLLLLGVAGLALRRRRA